MRIVLLGSTLISVKHSVCRYVPLLWLADQIKLVKLIFILPFTNIFFPVRSS